MTGAWFVTGTDTAVGKTIVANALLRCARDAGLSTLGLKPVAAGCYLRDGRFVNEDAWELLHSSTVKVSYEDVNPVALREPMAPHIAAAREKVSLDAAALRDHCAGLAQRADFTLVEGAGGWLVPLDDSVTLADLAADLGFPVILVVGMRLGCINHALLSIAAIEQAGLPLAGWVANHIDPDMAVQDANVATLEARIGAPLLGRIPHLETVGAVMAARHLQLDALLA